MCMTKKMAEGHWCMILTTAVKWYMLISCSICQGVDSANKNGRLLHSRQNLAYSAELVITYDAFL